jgi:hypothetical protein
MMIEFPVVLVINCGSSSVKFSVLDASSCDALMTGIADGINTEKAFISVNGGEPARLAHQDYEGALAAIALELEKRNLMSSVALIGHRIAHGGELFSESTLITKRLSNRSARFPLAPLHNYANLSGVEAAERCSRACSRWRYLIPASTRRCRRRRICTVCRTAILKSWACVATVSTAPHRYVSGQAHRCWAVPR